jgi:hypothetical protein
VQRHRGAGEFWDSCPLNRRQTLRPRDSKGSRKRSPEPPANLLIPFTRILLEQLPLHCIVAAMTEYAKWDAADRLATELLIAPHAPDYPKALVLLRKSIEECGGALATALLGLLEAEGDRPQTLKTIRQIARCMLRVNSRWLGC